MRLGYVIRKRTCFCFEESPRRALSFASQGCMYAAKNSLDYGDSIHRLF